MSAAAAAKPPRPCTEYNIFFQLERSYILQVELHSEPAVDGEAFRTSQPSYAGLPALPDRYASLVLPYDWFLPGKEKRRKRKHRKSHGAIGFHELSTKVANAWKRVDDEVKAYCSQVCAAGFVTYKAAMTEWKRKSGHQDLREKMVKKSNRLWLQTRQTTNSDVNAVRPEVFASAMNMNAPAPSAPVQKPFVQNKDVPNPSTQEAIDMEDINQAFEDDIGIMGDEVLLGIWGAIQDEPLLDLPLEENTSSGDQVTSSAAPSIEVSNVNVEESAQRNVMRSSVVSNDESVDMADSEILNIWNETDAAGTQEDYCFGYSGYPQQSNLAQDVQKSVFGVKGYAQTMADVQQLKLILEQQMAQIENVRRRPVRRLSVVACSA